MLLRGAGAHGGGGESGLMAMSIRAAGPIWTGRVAFSRKPRGYALRESFQKS
jgi:hypothetical protein